MNSSLEEWGYAFIWRMIQIEYPRDDYPSQPEITYFLEGATNGSTEMVSFEYPTDSERWIIQFIKTEINEFLLQWHGVSSFILLVLNIPSNPYNIICEYVTEISQYATRSARPLSSMYFLQHIFPAVIAKMIDTYNKTDYRQVDELSSTYETLKDKNWLMCEEISALPRCFDDDNKYEKEDRNPIFIWLAKLGKSQEQKKIICAILSIYEEENIAPWNAVHWCKDFVYFMASSSGVSTLLHTKNDDDANIELLWVGLVFSGVLIIKTSRQYYYGGDRYSFDLFSRSGEHIQKSFSFNGGFPSIATIEDCFILIYTSQDLYIRTEFLEGVAALSVKGLLEISYNSKYDLCCRTKEKTVYFVEKYKYLFSSFFCFL